MQEILNDYAKRSRYPNQPTKMRCIFESSDLWEIQLSTGKVELGKDGKFNDDISDALSICGAVDMTVNFASEGKKLSDSDWKTWFFNRIYNKWIVIDTNFVLRHYFSSILATRMTKDELKKIVLYMPRMVVLEIERRGNESKKDGIEGKNKRLAFYAAKEIRDLRELTNFDMIPLIDPSLMVEFAEREGSGFGDMWIRKEVHDLVKYPSIGLTNSISSTDVVFITCDLMNSMAAEAEGLTSCYFSRLTQENFSVYRYDSQFFNFVIANAVIFGKIKIDFIESNGDAEDSFVIEGVWKGKTTSEWYSDCLRVDWLSAK